MTRPAIARTSVVFPAPFGPRRPRISLSDRSSETPSTAVNEPKCLTRSATRSGMGGIHMSVRHSEPLLGVARQPEAVVGVAQIGRKAGARGAWRDLDVMAPRPAA